MKPVGWKKLLRQLLTTKDTPPDKKGEKSKVTPFQWILIIACMGIAAMILHNFFSLNNELQPIVSTTEEGQEEIQTFNPARSSPHTMEEYEQFYENQLQEILSKVIGVGEVAVMVNLESTEQVVVERNKRTQQSQTKEQDREGGSRTIDDHMSDEQVVIVRSDKGEEPVVIMTRKPQVRGVLVVAKGADNIQVKAWIVEAVQRVLDVPLHKISVLPKK